MILATIHDLMFMSLIVEKVLLLTMICLQMVNAPERLKLSVKLVKIGICNNNISYEGVCMYEFPG